MRIETRFSLTLGESIISIVMKRRTRLLFLLLTLFQSRSHAADLVEFIPSRTGLEPRMTFQIDQRKDAIQFDWTRRGQLQFAPSVAGPWSPVEGVRGVRFSLSLSDAKESMKYFRVLPLADAPTRPVVLQVPQGYTEEDSYPFIMNLHPFDGDPSELEERALPLAHLVDSKAFLYCTPLGFPESGTPAPGFLNPLGWNATDACCKSVSEQERVDDVGFLTSIVEWVQENYSVDSNRIYVTGVSNGGYMVHRLLCERSDLFAAGVSHAGQLWKDESRCRPLHPVQVLQIHSLKDEVVRYGGGSAVGVYPGVLEMLADWAEILGCVGELEKTDMTLDLDLSVAAEGRETEVFRYLNCEGSAVELWRKKAGLHRPSVRREGKISELPEAVIEWLYAHPKRF